LTTSDIFMPIPELMRIGRNEDQFVVVDIGDGDLVRHADIRLLAGVQNLVPTHIAGGQNADGLGQ